jgi:hypothetical protein
MLVRLELQVGNTPTHLPPLWVEVSDDNFPRSEETLWNQIQLVRRRVVATSYRMLNITVRDATGRVLDAETRARYPWLGALVRQAYEWFEAPDSVGDARVSGAPGRLVDQEPNNGATRNEARNA